MNWLAFLMTGSAEIASAGDDEPKKAPLASASVSRDSSNDYDFENSYVPLDETMGDPFAD